MKNFIVKVWNWIIFSSANPEKVSATIKFALVGIIPYILQATTLACGLHLGCFEVSNDQLTNVIQGLSNVAFWSLSIVATLGTIWAFFRKVSRTADGTNATLNAMQ